MKDIKKLFPIFRHHPDLVFLDSGASAQKPESVLTAVQGCYEQNYANIHRGLYSLSLEATKLFDEARGTVARFFGVSSEEIIFTKNGTEAANLFVNSWAKTFLRAGDEIVISMAEHHANFVPWLKLREEHGVILKFVHPNNEGIFQIEDFTAVVGSHTKLIAVTHVSNVTGQIFPIAEIAALAHAWDAITLVDICQSAPHFPVDLKQLNVDAAFFTGHKMGAPGGTGGLFVRKEILQKMPPFLVGGDMVDTVSTEEFTTLAAPQKFEAGTPAIAEIIGLAAAIRFLQEQDLSAIRKHEEELLDFALKLFAKKLQHWKIIGPLSVQERSSLLAFHHEKIHPHDVAQFLDTKNICVRSGLHCAEPIHRFLEHKNGSVRASFWVYTERQDIEKLVAALQEAEEIFAK